MARQYDPRPPECQRPYSGRGLRVETRHHATAMKGSWTGALILLGTVAALPAASQLATSDPIAYSRRVWQSADGLPEDFAQTITQTQDGYLWVGTSGGLVRFDGTRFAVFSREN